jgi:cytochrome c oxidase subunit 2
MGRRAPGQVSDAAAGVGDAEQAARRLTGLARRRQGLARALPLLGMAAVVALVLAGCGGAQPYSTLSPKTSKADDIQNLYRIIFWAATVVFIGVQAAIVYIILRFRRRNEDRPEQIHGNRRLELAWTIIPAVVLLVIFIPTAQVIYNHASAEENADFSVDVYGKQWWWEIQYPNIPGSKEGPDEHLTTANEIHIPQGADVVFNMRSNNVIHSFWVPQLSGKKDIIPGHDNKLQFKADTPGEYFGECAEFCGAAHAWMRFRVIVEPKPVFDAWVAAWHQPPPVPDANPTTADVNDTPPAFGVCLVCHRVSGTNAQIAQQGINANVESIGAGPNLTMFGCRHTIGAGILENTPENLKTWLEHTDQVKEGVYMPNYYKAGQIKDQQVAELVDYLGKLKPAGGCPPEQPFGGGTPVAGS